MRSKKKEVLGQSRSLDRTDAPAAVAAGVAVVVEGLSTRSGGPCCGMIGKGRIDQTTDNWRRKYKKERECEIK